MSAPEEQKLSTEEDRVAAMWQIPYTCMLCKGTTPLTKQTTECTLCKKPLDGATAMRGFWAILHDEKAWREWHENNTAGSLLECEGTDADWVEDGDMLVATGAVAANLLKDLGVQTEVAIEQEPDTTKKDT